MSESIEQKRERCRNYMRMRRLTDPEYGRDWMRKNPERVRAARRRWVEAHREQDRAWRRKHKGAKNPSGELKHDPCEICGRICDLHYDHDHKTGEFRGWLCGSCNRGIGAFRENITALRKAIKYLESANCVADYAERVLEACKP